MNNLDKISITLILPAFNEAYGISKTISHYQNIGYSNILVVNDCSRDDTEKKALKSGAKVITNSNLNGFSLSVLRGLYHVDTSKSLIVDPYRLLKEKELNEFLEFALKGNYGILFSKNSSKKNKLSKVTKYLKRRFGIFLENPDFDIAFLNDEIMKSLKEDYTLSESYLYFSLITLALNLKLKIGTYGLGESRVFSNSTLSNLLKLTNRRDRYYNPKKYFSFAIPDTNKNEFNNTVKVVIISSFLTLLITLFGVLLNANIH